MIKINYDPILGCTGWDFPKPKRVPLTKIERGEYIKKYFENRSRQGKKMLGLLTQSLPQNKKLKKENQFTWNLLNTKNKPDEKISRNKSSKC